MALLQDSPNGLNFLGGSSDSGLGGGGVITGLILGALLGRNGLGGLGGAASDSMTTNLTNFATKDDLIQQTLGDIKASIPYNEAQVQLALAGAVTAINNQSNLNTMTVTAGQTAAALAAATNAALIARDIASVDTNVDRQSTAVQIAIKDDGEKTRALITANTIADLNQRLTVAQLDNAENRAINREQQNSHNTTITMTNNQNQNQLQFQQQAQVQAQLVNLLVGLTGQIARATNSNVVVGSTGVGTSQTANPTNVAA